MRRHTLEDRSELISCIENGNYAKAARIAAGECSPGPFVSLWPGVKAACRVCPVDMESASASEGTSPPGLSRKGGFGIEPDGVLSLTQACGRPWGSDAGVPRVAWCGCSASSGSCQTL